MADLSAIPHAATVWQSQPLQQHQDGEPTGDTGGEAAGDGGTSTPAAPATSIDDYLDRVEAGQPDIDTSTGDAAEPAATAAPAAATPEPAATTPPAATVEEGTDSWLATATPDQIQSYISRLNRESASRRVQLREAEELFEGFEPEGREFVQDLVRNIRGNPAAARASALQLAELLANTDGQAAPAADDGLADFDPDLPLTAGQMQQLLDQRDRAAQQRTQAAEAQRVDRERQDQIVTTAKELGYEPKLADGTDNRDYNRLLLEAVTFHNGDLGAADKALKAERQAVIDEFVRSKATQQDGAAATSPQAGGGPSPETKIGSLKDADRALDAHLESLGMRR